MRTKQRFIQHPLSVVWLALVLWPLGLHAAGDDSPLGEGSVSRAVFTSGIVNREPVDQLVVVDSAIDEVYFFTELKFLTGRTVVHRWEYNGSVVAEVPFNVGGPRWRVYSKKSLLPHQAGQWTVVVVDQQSGWPLLAELFMYEPFEPLSADTP